MSTEKPYLSHIERTANSTREADVHSLTLNLITPANSTIRLFRLQPKPGHKLTHKPGQWVDLSLPRLVKPGGFTITSAPSTLSLPNEPYLELAVKQSPQNPAAEWLWRPETDIIGQEVKVRVGGEFVWPPTDIELSSIKRAVFIAGGVGINPLMSMLSFLAEQKEKTVDGKLGMKVVLLYSFRCGGGASIPALEVLFLDRLAGVFQSLKEEMEVRLFFTTGFGNEAMPAAMTEVNMKVRWGRMENDDVFEALGNVDERINTVCYVCGVPSMTDRIVETLRKAGGMEEGRVFSEKWW